MDVAFPSHEFLLVKSGSIGTVNHADIRSDSMLDTGIHLVALSIHGHCPFSIWDTTIAVWICDKAVLRATSLALFWADCILGNNAAARIHTITKIINNGNIHAKIFSRVLVSACSQYSFPHLFHGANQRYNVTIKLTNGINKSNCHHHDHQRSWNLLLLSQTLQYIEKNKSGSHNKRYTIQSKPELSKIVHNRVIIDEHILITKLKIILLAMYFALQILLSDVHVARLTKELRKPSFVAAILNLVKK